MFDLACNTAISRALAFCPTKNEFYVQLNLLNVQHHPDDKYLEIRLDGILQYQDLILGQIHLGFLNFQVVLGLKTTCNI